MNIIQVSNTDLPGRKFNGHDLQLSLNKLGHTTHQLVLEKLGKEENLQLRYVIIMNYLLEVF